MCGGGRRVTCVWWREKGDPCGGGGEGVTTMKT